MKNIFKIATLAIALFLTVSAANAQIQVGAYVDGYIGTTNHAGYSVGTQSTTGFPFDLSNSQEDAFGLNLGQIFIKANNKDWRGNVTIHAGDIPNNIGWPSVVEDFNFIQQAWGGVQLFKGFWVDGGYFISHVRSEDIVPMNNFVTTTSLLSAVEPWTQAGLKLSYQIIEPLHASLYILNNVGTFTENNFNKTFGLSLGYAPEDMNMNFGYNGIFGNQVPGAPFLAKLGMWHQVNFGMTEIAEMVDVRATFDYASQEDGVRNDNNELEDGTLIGFGLGGRVHILENLKAALRFSYVGNDDGIAFNEAYPDLSGFDVVLGVEYNPTKNSYMRLEGQMVNFTEGDEAEGFPGRIFFDGTENTNSRLGLALSMGIWLQ